MGMTMTQKILAAHAGLDEVVAGQLINAKLDIVLGNDITTPVAVNEFNKAGFDNVFDKDRVAIVLDQQFRQRGKERPVGGIRKGQMAFFSAVFGIFYLRKMGMEALHALFAQLIFHGQQNALVILSPADAPQRTGIEMAEIDAGQQTLIQLAQLHQRIHRLHISD